MIKPFEFYLDFNNPYTFLAHKQIRKIEKENLDINPRTFLIESVDKK